MNQKIIAVLLGLLGMLIGLTIWHTYNDHILIHQVVDVIQQSMKQQATK